MLSADLSSSTTTTYASAEDTGLVGGGVGAGAGVRGVGASAGVRGLGAGRGVGGGVAGGMAKGVTEPSFLSSINRDPQNTTSTIADNTSLEVDNSGGLQIEYTTAGAVMAFYFCSSAVV